jgi:hypothetical protein
VTIAERFLAALDRLTGPDLDGAELLPTRLSRAAVDTLPVDGAGLSLLDPPGHRMPLGASDEHAACAERLQFTAGDGPCSTAQSSGEPVFAVLDDLRRRWPGFADLLVENTPYRAVVALPLPRSLSGTGAMDLLFTDPAAVPKLDVFDALAVAELVTSQLSEAAVWSHWPAERGPDFLHGPPARRRAAVWEAMGKLCLEMEVDSPTALDVLRAAAYASGRSVDDLAVDLLRGRLQPDDLRWLGVEESS